MHIIGLIPVFKCEQNYIVLLKLTAKFCALNSCVLVVSPKRDKATHQGQASANDKQKQERLSSIRDTDLNRSDLTIAGEVTGHAVQLQY